MPAENWVGSKLVRTNQIVRHIDRCRTQRLRNLATNRKWIVDDVRQRACAVEGKECHVTTRSCANNFRSGSRGTNFTTPLIGREIWRCSSVAWRAIKRTQWGWYDGAKYGMWKPVLWRSSWTMMMMMSMTMTMMVTMMTMEIMMVGGKGGQHVMTSFDLIFFNQSFN